MRVEHVCGVAVGPLPWGMNVEGEYGKPMLDVSGMRQSRRLQTIVISSSAGGSPSLAAQRRRAARAAKHSRRGV
jgi:hypothetical protein